ncbi:hypothetical protein CHS0354_006198 [Potamilus streckersoni]|uniref:NTF2-related export protein n=1 Tax=Potamilus streckersoni TaxID=2493646 RepID=A0AAE0SRF7_9BIVA|nr:hypothetical protein CHS0354_006198 [Potamilus streckersoni]
MSFTAQAQPATDNLNPQFMEIGQQFVQAYYPIFDDALQRPKLEPMYHANAFLTFEDDQRMGRDKIVDKLKNLPFQKVAHALTKIDCQPTTDGGVLINVLGQVKVDDDRPIGFSHVFVLRPQDGTFYIMHEIFRLALHNIPDGS